MRSKKTIISIICIGMLFTFCGCSLLKEQWDVVEKYRQETTTTEKTTEKATTEPLPEQRVFADYIDESADTLGERILVPNGYKRMGEKKKTGKNVTAVKKSKTKNSTETQTTTTQQDATTQQGTTTEDPAWARTNTSGKKVTMETFMRELPVKKADAKLLYYNGQEKKEQDSYAAILNLKLDKKNLQQRASSVMRLYAEYAWQNQDFSAMKYHLGSGFLMDYTEWIKGKRLRVSNNNASWYDAGITGDNYETLLAYLEYYFCYSGMNSLITDSEKADVDKITVGDYFLDEKKENAAIVVDVAEDAKGNRCFLLATGGSPAQDIVVLKNPEEKGPWYFVKDLGKTFQTPEFTLSGDTCWHLKTPAAQTAQSTTQETTKQGSTTQGSGTAKSATTQSDSVN